MRTAQSDSSASIPYTRCACPLWLSSIKTGTSANRRAEERRRQMTSKLHPLFLFSPAPLLLSLVTSVGQLLVMPPAIIDGLLRLSQQILRRFRVALQQNAVASFGVDVIL